MGHKQTLYFLAVLFILTGALLTLENIGQISGISVHWPFFLLLLGSGFVMLFFEKRDIVMIWLGSFILLLGLFFYFLNFTEWTRLATLWPVFLGIAGFSFMATGFVSTGRLYYFFAIFFIALFLVFTLVFTISPILWPVSFVIFGLSLVALQFLLRRGEIEG